MEIVKLKNHVYTFSKYPNETELIYQDRVKILRKMEPKTEKEFVNVVKLSLFYVYMKHLGCTYRNQEKIMEKMDVSFP